MSIPLPHEIEDFVSQNVSAGNNEFRMTHHTIASTPVTTFTYDTGSGHGFDLINVDNTYWLYLPHSEDSNDDMIMRADLEELIPIDPIFLNAHDFTLLDSDCGPGAVYYCDTDSDEWQVLQDGESITVAEKIMEF